MGATFTVGRAVDCFDVRSTVRFYDSAEEGFMRLHTGRVCAMLGMAGKAAYEGLVTATRVYPGGEADWMF